MDQPKQYKCDRCGGQFDEGDIRCPIFIDADLLRSEASYTSWVVCKDCLGTIKELLRLAMDCAVMIPQQRPRPAGGVRLDALSIKSSVKEAKDPPGQKGQRAKPKEPPTGWDVAT
jgi:hypothetical protein